MNFDFDSIRTRLITNLRKRISWVNILPNSVSMRLIDTIAEEQAEMNRYNEYLTRESKWDLARNISSLFYMSSLLGYNPHRKIGATGVLEVSSNEKAFSTQWITYVTYNTGDYIRHNGIIYYSAIDTNLASEPTLVNTDWVRYRTNHTQNIGIPKYTEFSSDNLSYVSTASKTLGASDDYIEVPIIQGEKREYNSIASGTLFEEVYIEHNSIENNFYEVYINNTKWSEVDNLKGANATDFVYQTSSTADYSKVYFKFGDDTTGKKLISGDTITIYWIETSGSAGNITTQGIITSVNTSLKNILGISIPLFCYNYNSVAGGKDVENLESIRRNGIASFQAGGNLVSVPDYKSFLETGFDFISKAVVWGAYEQNLDAGEDLWEWIQPSENMIFVAGITPGNNPLDILLNADGTSNDSYKIALIKEMRDIKSPSDIVSFHNVEFIYMTVVSNVRVENENYLLDEMASTVKDTIIDTYEIENMSFRQEVYESNYQRLIDEIEGVQYHTTEFSFYKKTVFESGFAITNTILPIHPIEEGSIKVVAETLDGETSYEIVSSDVGGALTPEATYDPFTTGTIDYTTGDLTLVLDGTGPLGNEAEYIVKIYYDSVSKDILPEFRYQILNLDSDAVNVTTSYYEGI